MQGHESPKPKCWTKAPLRGHELERWQVLHGEDLQADHWKIYPCVPWSRWNFVGGELMKIANL